ncbi:substrate-binding periplasmic protein [Thalassomonas haliotis]|uniref:Solute-binding protein family 3/N-terminal domain-containing protein n=1 Tax=Thalassomonas haliotis TaxID=485448 RepID=A0ABY7VGK0_9GAMM|nr:hypothetical protein [Thalassomonas haliotis]WDE12603.1 hypothetical protein H3N35_03745 [Thalassomonas haliotis]
MSARIHFSAFIVCFCLTLCLILLPTCVDSFTYQQGAESASNKTAGGKRLPEKIKNKEERTFYLAAPEEVSFFAETIRVVTQAYNNIGYQVEIVKMPAKRAIHEAVYGDWVDGEVGRTALAGELMTNYTPIDVPLGTLEIYAYFLKDRLKATLNASDWLSLSGYRVASIRGFIILTQLLKKHQLDFQLVTHPAQAFEMLLRQRVDLVILAAPIAEQMLKRKQFQQVTSSMKPIEKINIYHYLHNKHQAIVPALTLSLSQLLPEENLLGSKQE